MGMRSESRIVEANIAEEQPAIPLPPQLRTLRKSCNLPIMLDWLLKRFGNASPLAQWSVSFDGDEIVTSDGRGEERKMALSDLTRVVVATDDSGPWGADVVFLLYSSEADPTCLFPLEANGRDSFVDWLSMQPGYKDCELVRAMGSTKIARFEVLTVGQNDS